jgi:hypothetical protein
VNRFREPRAVRSIGRRFHADNTPRSNLAIVR